MRSMKRLVWIFLGTIALLASIVAVVVRQRSTPRQETPSGYRQTPLWRGYDRLSDPEAKPAILTPNPRTVSIELLTREKFQPATTVNMLNNYPRFLQNFERPDGHFMDLAATDIMRTRELGVPRYNQFRRLLHLPPANNFAELTGDPALAEKIRRVYNNDIERVDLIVGMFAEKRPAGFAFSETAFRIFILMASRRLNSDRFFTKDFTPEVYTQVGMDWIRDNSMSTLLLRHYPHLRPALRGIGNAFTPWRKIVV